VKVETLIRIKQKGSIPN